MGNLELYVNGNDASKAPSLLLIAGNHQCKNAAVAMRVPASLEAKQNMIDIVALYLVRLQREVKEDLQSRGVSV